MLNLDILFLDIDDVLNLEKANSATAFSPDCVAQFNRFFATS